MDSSIDKIVAVVRATVERSVRTVLRIVLYVGVGLLFRRMIMYAIVIVNE